MQNLRLLQANGKTKRLCSFAKRLTMYCSAFWVWARSAQSSANRTAFFTSSSVSRSLSSVFTSAWGILSKEDSSTLRLSLKRLLKCPDQRCMMASLSVRRVEPSAERRGAWIWCEGPCKALRVSKNERVSPRSAYICIFFARSVHQSFFITRSLFCRVLQAVLYAAFKLLLSGFVKRRWWLKRFISNSSWISVSESSNQSLCFLDEKPATSAVVS